MSPLFTVLALALACLLLGLPALAEPTRRRYLLGSALVVALNVFAALTPVPRAL